VFKKVTIVYTLLIIFISLIPIPQLPLPKFDLFQWDKFFHVLVYLIMSLMWLRLGFFQTNSLKYSYLTIVVLIGVITESLQGLLPIGRYFEIADIIANFCGILIGFALTKLYIFKNKLS
jgi:VanZ family protein|tara:strand:- start:1270 stop:1626 length:357 start_codon:yes stop_codon:yes gene_type:complete